ncbi:MAG: hypothetical protein ACXWHZ_16550 [Usitatibacter sp.]
MKSRNSSIAGWLAPDHRYFKVSADDGRIYVLRHDARSDEWELAGLVGREPSLPCGGVSH